MEDWVWEMLRYQSKWLPFTVHWQECSPMATTTCKGRVLRKKRVRYGIRQQSSPSYVVAGPGFKPRSVCQSPPFLSLPSSVPLIRAVLSLPPEGLPLAPAESPHAAPLPACFRVLSILRCLFPVLWPCISVLTPLLSGSSPPHAEGLPATLDLHPESLCPSICCTPMCRLLPILHGLVVIKGLFSVLNAGTIFGKSMVSAYTTG